jgi:GNAT superfamily N-acetyltransferase
MKAEVIIRQGKMEDIESLSDLLRQLFTIEEDFEFNEGKQRAGLKLMMDSDSSQRFILVAERDEELIGMCSAQVVISTAEGGKAALLEDMVVEQGQRGQGIGAKLLTGIINWAEEYGITRLQLLADKNNRPALDFYEKNNWKMTQLTCLRKTMQA